MNICVRLTFGIAVLLLASAVPADDLTEDDIRWRRKMGWNPQVHGSVQLRKLKEIVERVPYAYYPYPNELEVLFDYAPAVELLPDEATAPKDPPGEMTVKVYREEGDRPVWKETIELDAKGRGHGLFKLPKLPEGTFRVEYEFGGVTLRAGRTFTRSYFEFERNDIGEIHAVYPPFTPVEVEGNRVSVVDRTYTINEVGLFGSVVSKGRELLAEPMRLVVETPEDHVKWKAGGVGDGVEGEVIHPDTAVFRTEATGKAIRVRCAVKVEEDGCAKIEMTLAPRGTDRQHSNAVESERSQSKAPVIRKAWIEMALKESRAPLCHLVGMNSMRHNYAGRVPRGGRITWINQAWRPARFETEPFEAEPPASYEVWDATKNMHWHSERWNFAPYVWLGAARRGLAWFGDHTAGYETDGKRGIQRLRIEPHQVVLRVELIQQPIALDLPRTFVFGLQASPTRPMRKGWRGYGVPGGGGMPVNVWGGYNCAWHYPDPKDWRIVEKIVAARDPEVGPKNEDFRAFFEKMNEKRRFPDLKVHGRQEWLDNVLMFAGRAGRNPNGITVYYEEFQTSGHHPESYEYMDEWDLGNWCRYSKHYYHWQNRGRKAWGPQARTANQESWRDFAVYYADQWMRRGVGIYYDNTPPRPDYNHFNLRRHGVPWQNCIWGHRAYFRRVWKRSRQLMQKGMTPIDPLTRGTDDERRMRLHTVGHVTNCQVLPFTTWWDATLGVEQPGQWIPEDGPSPEEMQRQVDERGFVILPTPKKGAKGRALPLPPDYLRAMTMGRTAGLIPHYRHALRSEDAFGGLGISYGASGRPKEEILDHRRLSDKAMGLVHEIRGGGNPYKHAGIRTLMAAFQEYGYGRPEVTVHNYWADDPRLTLDNPDVKWIALEKPGHPLLALLQSYRAEACRSDVDLPAGAAILDLFTRRLHPAEEPVSFETDYGTRLLLIAQSEDPLAPLAWDEDVLVQADFQFGLPPAWVARGPHAPRIVPDPEDERNKVLRITPGHPSRNFIKGTTRGDYRLSFRFRLPKLTEKPPYPRFYGFLQLRHREVNGWPKQSGQVLALGVKNDDEGRPAPAMTYITRREGEVEEFRNGGLNRLKKVGELIPLDSAWHTVTITVRGHRQRVSIDGHEVFSGETDVTDGGSLLLGPGWSSWKSGPPHVDVDDLLVRELAQ